jgi:hypothetical protein
MIKFCIALVTCLIGFASYNYKIGSSDAEVIAMGSVPRLVKDSRNMLHLVFGNGDSVLYAVSGDGGKSFSKPKLVDRVPDLFSFAMRGPQITASENGPCILVATQQGNILAYRKGGSGKWEGPVRVNDQDTVAKEGFLALDGDGKKGLFAVWLDLRQGQNNIYGARSADGGKTWSKNKMIYTSPDGHVCECCKPSVAIQGKQVAVMFRNWLAGNRDLYLIRSFDGGQTFQQAEKLGLGNWKLDGCPMDGGGLVIGRNGRVQTVWRRQDKIFVAQPGAEEQEVGRGRSCTIETVNGKMVYTWVEGGEIVVKKPDGSKLNLGKGQLPVLQATGEKQAVCVWEKEGQIMKAVVAI